MRHFALLMLAVAALACDVKRIKAPEPLEVVMTPVSHAMEVGENILIKAEITGNIGLVQLFEWESSEPSVASVDLTGRVTAHAPGTVAITARWSRDTTHSGTSTITIFTPPVSEDRASGRTALSPAVAPLPRSGLF